MPLYLRIAPELYLKRLLVGGLRKVFEIGAQLDPGKNFRNESIDQTHNPEFTSCELYCAYSDYVAMLRFTKDLLCSLVRGFFGTARAVLALDSTTLDLEAEWTVLDFVPELEQSLGIRLPADLSSEAARAFLDQLCRDRQIECEDPRSNSRLLDKLAERFLESRTLQPLVIMNHPTCMSPLAKPHAHNPEITQRFELFLNGWEVVNSYTELNDPEIQRRNTPSDHEYVRALEYGLPPCAGWGLGVDRLAMLLTKSKRIQEVIAFPLLRPEADQAEAHSPSPK